MNNYSAKTNDTKSHTLTHEATQRKSSKKSGDYFVDNRPETVMQRKLQEVADNSSRSKQIAQFQQKSNNTIHTPILQKKKNKTGLPDSLKTGIENLSGYSMDDVKVHYNSNKPAQLQAHAYAQGTDIHIGSGQEKHLPHEAWHVVQQKQGRVQPTVQMKSGVKVNDDAGLEKEADVMGAKAAFMKPFQSPDLPILSVVPFSNHITTQRFGDGTEEEIVAGKAFEADLQRYSELSGLVRFRFQPQLDGYRGREMDKEVQEELLHTKIELIELRAKIIDGRRSIKLSSLDTYYTPLLEQILAGRGHEDNIQKVDNPRRMGKEIELTSLTLVSGVKQNGVILAATTATELDLPVLKIETEGADRGTLSIELINGPLPVEEYTTTVYQNALKKLYAAFEKGTSKSFKDFIDQYNSSLDENEFRYKLTVSEAGATYKAKGGKTAKNVQTNVAVPYAAIGNKEAGIDKLFVGEKKDSTEFFSAARDHANTIADKIARGFPYHNLISLLTQIIYHDAMYGDLRLQKGKEKKEDKQKFHVMFKVSPEDGVFSILSDREILALYRWILATDGKDIITAVADLLKGTMGTDRKKFGSSAATISVSQLKIAAHERLLQGKQALGRVSDDKPTSTPELGGSIRHSVPRPSNRIPVMQTPDGESHVVIEQRSSGHPLNRE